MAQWQSTGGLKPEVSWVRFPVAAGLFTSSIFASLYLNSFISSVSQDALSTPVCYRCLNLP